MKAINPDVNVVKYETRLDASNIMEIIEGYDVIVDGVDNFPTRYLLNDATVRLRIPVVSASILGFDGQLRSSSPTTARATAACTPCRRRPSWRRPAAPTASSACCRGRWACCRRPRSSSSSSGTGEPLIGRLLLYEALGATFTELKVRRDPECPVCSRPPEEISDDEMGVFPDYEAFCAAAG